jgi:hypothetical protein
MRYLQLQGKLSGCGSLPSQSGTLIMGSKAAPMNERMTPMTLPSTGSNAGSPWALQMRAASTDEPARLIQMLTGAILGIGGWVLSRGANDAGMCNMLFEFERQQCMEIYTALIAAGLELSPLAHLRFTELCQCTRSHHEDCGGEIVSIELEIQSFSAESSSESRMAAETT